LAASVALLSFACATPFTAESASGGSLACAPSEVEIPIAAREALRARFSWLLSPSTYPLEGRWTAGNNVLMAPGTAFVGTLGIEMRDGPFRSQQPCSSGIAMPLSISLRVDGITVADRVDGSATVLDVFDAQTGSVANRADSHQIVYAGAEFDPAALADSMRVAVSAQYVIDAAHLSPAVTPFGTHGSLQIGAAVASKPSSPGAVSTVPWVPTALMWPEANPCEEGYGKSLTAPPDAMSMALQSAVDMTNRTYSAAYRDGGKVDVSLVLQRALLVCEFAGQPGMFADLQVRTSDNRMNVILPVRVLFHRATLAIHTPIHRPWAYTPQVFEQQFGSLGLDLSPFAHVGFQISLDSAAGIGSIRVFGFATNGCSGGCDSQGCASCSWNSSTQLLEIIVGE
jgi:hypothetical protein